MSNKYIEKRARSANFTGEEKILLLNIVKKYTNTLECKKTDAVTWRDKEETWHKIANEFNANCPVLHKRTVDNLKKFYENQKKIARKKAAEERQSTYATGGGPGVATIFTDPTLDLTMSIINQKSIYGLNNKFDGDSKSQTNIILEHDYEKENTENEPNTEFSENLEEIIIEMEDESVTENIKNDWQHYKPTSMQKPLNEKLKNVISTPENVRTPSKRKLNEDKDNSWTTRRRPCNSVNMTVARKFEQLTEVKTEIANFQLAIIKEEKEHQTAKFSREIEEYALKQAQTKELYELQKISLQLDIEIKKKQLEKLEMLN